jgi:hypothetical protein
MDGAETAAAWARLGKLLTERRARLDPRYMNRRLFASERGLDYRLVSDIEKARRQTFEGSTLAAIEAAYQLQPGAIGRFLAGGGLEETDVVLVAAPVTAPAPAPHRIPWLYDPAIEPYLPGVQHEVDEARTRLGRRNVTGDEAFPDNDLEADSWDDPKLTEDESLREIARNRMRLDRRRERGSERGASLWRTCPHHCHLWATVRRLSAGVIAFRRSHNKNRLHVPWGEPEHWRY